MDASASMTLRRHGPIFARIRQELQSVRIVFEFSVGTACSKFQKPIGISKLILFVRYGSQ
jgi:hypothetical protein